MDNNFNEIQELLNQKADFQARINLLAYDGTPEIKNINDKKYLYIRKRIGSRVTSTYVDAYSDDLYQLLLRNNRERRELNKSIRKIDKRLAELGFSSGELPEKIVLNLEFARANMKSNIYSQAVLEGVATTFPQTEDIIDNGKINGVTATDVQKILNLKHAWEFILDNDVIQCESNYYILCHIAKLVNEGFYSDGGRIRGVPVTIGGTSYIPPLPNELKVKDDIDKIVNSKNEYIYNAIQLCLYCMKTQIFNDGNKRASVIFANHYLISMGQGFIAISEEFVPEFKKLLVSYYEDKDNGEIAEFIKTKCWKTF
ncbi:MAG: Fic family protein [Acetobacter sp.]|nr:Fic family protein [Bacteroides sp.]MCM1342170.1 Fic family protein [Acetobacter sp.]MCM1433151.1 Fic family protein [Clostridiales bacterium]